MVPSGYDDMGAAHHFSPTDQEFEHDPVKRRFWLLRQALKSGSSMMEALQIAERVEAFLVVGIARARLMIRKTKLPLLRLKLRTPSRVHCREQLNHQFWNPRKRLR